MDSSVVVESIECELRRLLCQVDVAKTFKESFLEVSIRRYGGAPWLKLVRNSSLIQSSFCFNPLLLLKTLSVPVARPRTKGLFFSFFALRREMISSAHF